MVPLASVLAMQQVAVASQQQQANKTSLTGSSGAAAVTEAGSTVTATVVQQIDGFPPDIPKSTNHNLASISAHSNVERASSGEKCVPEGHGGCGLVGSTTSNACKKKMGTLSRGIPPGVLGKLLRQQRRRKKQGKVGGVPVEVIVQLDGANGGGRKGSGKGARPAEREGEGSSSDEDSDEYGDSSDEEEVEQVNLSGHTSQFRTPFQDTRHCLGHFIVNRTVSSTCVYVYTGG